MRQRREFSRAMRDGRRARRPHLIIHSAPGPADEPTKVGLVVSKQIGNSVVRHRVARRLRAVLADRLSAARLSSETDGWAMGHLLVVRALPGSATCSSTELAAELDRAWQLVQRPPRHA